MDNHGKVFSQRTSQDRAHQRGYGILRRHSPPPEWVPPSVSRNRHSPHQSSAIVIGQVTNKVVRGACVTGTGAFFRQNPSLSTPGRCFQNIHSEHRHRFSGIPPPSFSTDCPPGASGVPMGVCYQKWYRESIPVPEFPPHGDTELYATQGLTIDRRPSVL